VGIAARHPLRSTIPANVARVCADSVPASRTGGDACEDAPVQRALGDSIVVDDDPARVDVDAVHAFLANEAYWAKGRPRDVVARLVAEAARVVGLYDGDRQIGFARAATDGTSFVYLADVYVLPPYRGRGLGVELVREMVENGPLGHLPWLLHTRDAHALYRRVGFGDPSERLMERPRA
jgi:GNAT superfamily N-acetyltransferase